MKAFGLAATLLLASTAVPAQTPLDYLVRSCPTKPAATGFSACPTSTWAKPQDAMYLDALRRNVTGDVWVRPSELIANDRVYACSEPTMKPGPFGNGCTAPDGTKVKIPGQTDNYLDYTKLAFTAPSQVPFVTFGWGIPATNTDGTPVVDLAGFNVFIRIQPCDPALPNCPVAGFAAPIAVPATTLKYTVSNVIAFAICISIQARNIPGDVGLLSDDLCTYEMKLRSVPGKVPGVAVIDLRKP